MPPKPKGSTKPEQPTTATAAEPASNIAQRSEARYYDTNPLQSKVDAQGIAALTPVEKKTYTYTSLIVPVIQSTVTLSNKAEREYWKQVSKENLPIRRLDKAHDWGKDKSGRDISTYTIDEFEARKLKQAQLAALTLLHRRFLAKRARDGAATSSEDVEQEKTRRKEMATLKKDLYGEIAGSLANEPEWDDVVPIPHDEPEDALARIAYPDEYAEAISYLRAVMASKELSPRSLRLTEHVISMNPAHYTVWLFRFKIVKTLQLPVPDEITWLNSVALENLKNYQIWHHRSLLLDYYAPTILSDADTVKSFGRSEISFINTMLEDDAKNYHVWSYRQYLVRTLNLFNMAELLATQNLIETDVRNNSAWSHRFFLNFSDPAHSTPESLATEHDPKIPDSIIDREVTYATEKIHLAPQNQSAWNYLRGVLVKAGRPLSSVTNTAQAYVSSLGEADEAVTSSHALDLLADIHQANGDTAQAKLCLSRLADKWDPIREGYWRYRIQQLK